MNYLEARQACLELGEELYKQDSHVAYTKPTFFPPPGEFDKGGMFRLFVMRRDGSSEYVGHYQVSG